MEERIAELTSVYKALAAQRAPQIRRYPQRLPVTAQRIPALLIGKIKNNIRSAHICPSHCGLGRRIRTTTPSVKQSAAYW